MITGGDLRQSRLDVGYKTFTISPWAPEKIQLNFSENLTVKFSGAKLTMTGMKGMSSHSPMPVAAKVAPGADPKSMVIIPREPLPAGTYRVDWRAVSSDTHPITGNYTFTVK
ncbi:copper homeostasis periplasmic binding protein CopC [Enterobacter hormaechei]|uniref:copper homeostasis periplasmic binding protein CopC n=1 Tax=Enterobacter hormaechei TaxID=158836 RepID=UPI001F3B5463|nr:copper homeostasis periplasmic binding protein CopC [Enterobacter hormaechei]